MENTLLLEILKELKEINANFAILRQNIEEGQKIKKEIITDRAEYQEILYQECDKRGLVFQIGHKTIDWNFQKRYFGFPSPLKAKQFLEARLQEDGLLSKP